MLENEPIIRRIESKDIASCKAILDNRLGFDYVGTADLKKYIEDDPFISIGLFLDEKICGVSIVQIGSPEDIFNELNLVDPKIEFALAKLDHLGLRKHTVVAKEFENQGFAGFLFNESIKLMNQQCDAILTTIWKEGNSRSMISLLNRSGFKKVKEIPGYWSKQSEWKKFVCPACKVIPCTCTGIIYLKIVERN